MMLLPFKMSSESESSNKPSEECGTICCNCTRTSEFCRMLSVCSRGTGEKKLPYFLGYKTEFFPFQNSPKNLDPSYKIDLNLWECLRRLKLVSQQNFIGLI